MNLKRALKSAPIIGPIIAKIRAPEFVSSSADYWDDRYATGGHSGAGSHGRLAHFKSEFLNGFVQRNGIRSVAELGSGDGAQLRLAAYPQYLGVDISRTAVEHCRKLYADQPHINFAHLSELPADYKAELSLSLDVVYHLVEDEVFDHYMRQLFNIATRAVIIYASNIDRAEAAHVRHRMFTPWVAENRPEWVLSETVPNRFPFNPADPDHTSFADFYVYLRKD